MKRKALFPPEQIVKDSKSLRLMLLFIFTLNVLLSWDKQGKLKKNIYIYKAIMVKVKLYQYVWTVRLT